MQLNTTSEKNHNTKEFCTVFPKNTTSKKWVADSEAWQNNTKRIKIKFTNSITLVDNQ